MKIEPPAPGQVVALPPLPWAEIRPSIVAVPSTCRKSAPLDWHAGTTDVYGQPRIHGKKGVDIGAVECQDSYGLMLILK